MPCERNPSGDHWMITSIIDGNIVCRFCGRTNDGIAMQELDAKVTELGEAMLEMIEAMALLEARLARLEPTP